MGDGNLIGPDGPENVFRSVADAEVSLDEMLSLACRQGKQDIVELLLESGAKVNYRNKAGNTPLLEACSQGHVSIARLLLERNADIDAPTETTSDSALTWACTLGNEDIVQLLLEHKAAIEHRTRDGCTALMFAALAGHEKVAKLLLDHGAKLNVESDSNKDSPLTFACWKGHQKVVELFLVHKANIEHRTKEGFSPLMFAALGGHTEVARLLLEKKAEVNNPSGSNNDIPLTSACWKGHHSVVELLLRYNSNIEHHTKDGCTPLMLAAREGHLSVAQLLLNHSAKVNVASGSENNIPLTLACWKGHRDVVELLLLYNSNIEHQNKAGCTPLMLAAREGHFEATELLLDHQAQLNVPSGSNDDTPLTLACWKGHEGVVSLLLDKQSSINHQTKTGCTPLMEATREGHVGVAKMLLESGADVETPDNYGQTPFFMACWKGHAEVASLLLDYGANKDCRTKTGITPFFQACRENHVDVVKLLLDYGCNPSSPFPNSRECPLTLAAEKGYTDLTQVLISRNANVECRTKKGCTPFFLASKEGFKEIAVMLVKHGADTEATDQRGITPLLAAFRNGHVEVVEWLLGHVAHLPSDLDCQKALMAPKSTEKDILPQRSKCLELIMKAKKAREQAALKNAQILFEELDAEKEKKETKRKAAARKRSKRKEKKKKEQAEKKAEVEREDDDDDDEEEEEDEEDEEIRPHPQVESLSSQTNENRNGLAPSSPSQTRKRSKKKGKKSVTEDVSLATPISNDMFSTAATRTSLQTPAHLVTDSWEEESGDEMFVDAPSEFLPDTASLCSQEGSCKDVEGSETLSREEEVEEKLTSSTASKTSKEKPPDAGDKTNQSKKPVKPVSTKKQKPKNNKETTETKPVLTCNKRNGPRGNNNIGSKNTPENVPEPPPKSPGERKKKVGGNKSPDLPVNDKKVSNNNNVWRVSPVISRQSEEECWDEELEPSTDWTNEDQSFISKQSTRTKAWSSVATVAIATTSISTATNSTPLTSMPCTTTTTSSKPWQEVSRAIKTHQLTVSNSLVGRIIGRKGMKINQIQADSGAQISISRAIPRSVDRLVTIKGTERSVNTAREMIEEALSTSSKENELPETDTQINSFQNGSQTLNSTQSVPTTTTVQTSPNTSTAVTNVWQQSSLSLAWRQKRYSDVVPPPSSALVQSEQGSRELDITSTGRRISLPINIPSTVVTDVVNSFNPVVTDPRATSPNNENPISTHSEATPSVSCTTQKPVVMTTTTSSHISRNGSLPLSSLTCLEEEDGDEVLKHKRSHSEPTATPISKSSSPTNSSRSTPPLTLPAFSNSRYSPTMPPIFSPSESDTRTMSVSSLSDSKESKTNSTRSNVDEPVVTTPSLSVVVPVTRGARTVGIVTPTQAVKPYQREIPSIQSSYTVVPATMSSSDSAAGRNKFGAIGPPNRRSSLPVVPANHYDINGYNSRKLSYTGIPVVQPVAGSLGVVPEAHSIPQREYSWPLGPPGPPLHPPTRDHTPSFMPNHMEWSGNGGFSEFERVRSQSWAGLHSENFGPHNDFQSTGGGPFHMDNHTHNHISHIHNPWGKFQPAHQNSTQSLRPPYHNRPHSNIGGYHPPMRPTNCGGNHFGSTMPRENIGNWTSNVPPPPPPPPGYMSHKAPPISQSGSDSSLPLSLRQVLGEKLEQEIFPGEGAIPSVDFSKDDSPSLSKRWSISSFPPQISTQNLSNGLSNESSTWGTNYHTHQPIPTFQQGDTTISDLAASWPIWSSPGPTHQPQSPFSPAGSLPASITGMEESGWSSSLETTPPSDLVELMKSLDIAEHIPALKNRKLSLQQLCSMSDEEWRDLNLPVGPRVKLMNAICNMTPEKLTVSAKTLPGDSFSESSFFQLGLEKGGHSDQLPLTPPSPYVQ